MLRNRAGLSGIGFYLSSDISDVHVRRAKLPVKLSVPELFHDLLPAVNPSGMACEGAENLKRCGCQIDTILAHQTLRPKPASRDFYPS
jgi:hypothetical protein